MVGVAVQPAEFGVVAGAGPVGVVDLGPEVVVDLGAYAALIETPPAAPAEELGA